MMHTAHYRCLHSYPDFPSLMSIAFTALIIWMMSAEYSIIKLLSFHFYSLRISDHVEQSVSSLTPCFFFHYTTTHCASLHTHTHKPGSRVLVPCPFPLPSPNSSSSTKRRSRKRIWSRDTYSLAWVNG